MPMFAKSSTSVSCPGELSERVEHRLRKYGVGLVFLCLFTLWNVARAEAMACEAEPILRIELGGKLFHIPRTFQPKLHGKNIRRRIARVCQGPDDPPIKVEFFVISGQSPQVQKDERTRPIRWVQIMVRSFEENSLPLGGGGAYQKVMRELVRLGIAVEDLPIRQGFHVYEPPEGKGAYHYTAIPGGATTPTGQPLSFSGCSAPVDPSGYQETWKTTCSNNYVLAGGIFLQYKIEKSYSVDKLKYIDDNVRQFVKKLGNEPE